MAGKGWGGRKVTNARAYWRPRLPLTCRRCGNPVMATPESGWQVGHIVDRWIKRDDSLANQWPEHTRCNTRAGGQVGARITNARRTPPAVDPRSRGIRGV